MLSSSLDTMLKLSVTTSPQKLFAYDCVTLYEQSVFLVISEENDVLGIFEALAR